MAFRDIFTGGACNVSDQSSQVNQNPFRQFLDNLVVGKGQQQQIINNMGVQQDMNMEQQIMQRQAQFQNMDKVWGQMQNEFQQMSMMEQQQMQQSYQQVQQDHEQYLQYQQHMVEQQWKEAEYQHEAQQLAQEFKFNEVYDNAEVELDEENKQKVIKGAANDMMNLMMNDPDPKFQNSKFLSFLKNINHGSLKIVDKQLFDQTGKVYEVPALEASLENAWQKSAEEYEEQKQQQEMKLPNYDDVWNEHVQDYERLRQDEQSFEKMLEQQYKNILHDMENGGDTDEMMSKAWQGASDVQEQQLYKDSNDNYIFQMDNPYSNEEFPLSISMQLAENGRTTESILAMEAHLQKNSNDANAWRIMGRLHQENDQDQRAVSSFLNALKQEPNNLDTLLALGISCTNILDEVKAMGFLKQWLMRNPEYQSIQVNPNVVPDDGSVYDFSMEQIKEMNHQMLHIYDQGLMINPNDANLLNGLAVLNFINRNYERSVDLFKKALQIEPKNYSLWNKLGATLAHLNEPDQAVFCYHRALDLRPNFVRVWVNLGIASAHKNDYTEAARLYLSALTLNPQAQHIWGYIQTSFMCMKRSDLIQKIQHYDPRVFQDEFEITQFQDLPQPELFYGDANQEFIFKIDTKNWLDEFNQFKQQ